MRAAILLSLAVASPAAAFEPTANYRKHDLQEFTVYLSPELLRHKREADAVVRQADIELERVGNVVPDKALEALRKVPIWMEWNEPADRAPVARFFPGPTGVKRLGLNPGKADGIEVPCANRFLANYQDGAQWVLMHELAHAHHTLALTNKQDAAVKAAHQQAVERKLYENVEHFNGVRTRGYAVTNHFEYYAVLSEAYFGKSFNFPYDRPGLLRYDTVGYWLMHDTWGKK
jgi:dipeptidyl-peptidase-4